MKIFYSFVLSQYLPSDIIRSNIIPFLNIFDRRGLHNNFQLKLKKELQYPREHLTGKAKRLCSYLNTIKTQDYTDVIIDRRGRLIIENPLFQSIISVYRHNYSTFSYFYFENQIHNKSVSLRVMEFHINRLIENTQIENICVAGDFCSVFISNKCPIGYYGESEFNYSGPRQLFRILYEFNKHLEIDLKHSMKETKLKS